MEEKIELTWIKLYIDKLLTSPDVARMETHEFGAYILLLLGSFHEKKRGFLKNDDTYLQKITRLKKRQWEKSRDLLLSKFNKNDEGLLYNERWLASIQEAENYLISNKERTRAARESRHSSGGGGYGNVKNSNWKSIDEYMAYRKQELELLDEDFKKALKDNIGITRPYCWVNKKSPNGYFDLVDCIERLRKDDEWQKSVMIDNNISKMKLLSNIYDFVKEIKNAQSYMSYDGYNGADGRDNFISHFVRWQNKRLNR